MSLLVLSNVSKSFGGVVAAADVNMTIEAGKITGLIGPNGAGKTTLVNLIIGIFYPTTGSIHLDGDDITRISPDAVVRKGIARTFQNIRLLRTETVLENVVAGFHRLQQASLWSDVMGLPASWRERSDFQKRGRILLERFGMASYEKQMAGTLSYGHQRRVEMMRALAMNPRLLLLDEPIAGMNDVEAFELGEMFKALADSGLAILMIEHNVGFVRSFCSHVYVLNTGRIIGEGAPDVVTSQAAVIEAYLGKRG